MPTPFLLVFIFFSAQFVYAQQKASVSLHAGFPEYLYEGDILEIITSLQNNTANEITGQLFLSLKDAQTGASVDGWMQNVFPAQYITVAAGKTTSVAFPLQVPYLFKKDIQWIVQFEKGALKDSVKGLLHIKTEKNFHEVRELFILQKNAFHATFQPLQKTAGAEHYQLQLELFTNPMLWMQHQMQDNSNKYAIHSRKRKSSLKDFTDSLNEYQSQTFSKPYASTTIFQKLQQQAMLQKSAPTFLPQMQAQLGPQPFLVNENSDTTAYFSKSFPITLMDSSFSHLKIEKKDTQTVFGAITWQYFTDAKPFSNKAARLIKQISIKQKNGSYKMHDGFSPLQKDDTVKVQLKLQALADANNITLVDFLPAAFMYYENKSTASMQGMGFSKSLNNGVMRYSFSKIKKGVTVLEYLLMPTQAGTFHAAAPALYNAQGQKLLTSEPLQWRVE